MTSEDNLLEKDSFDMRIAAVFLQDQQHIILSLQSLVFFYF